MQNDIADLENRTTRIERSLAQIFNQMEKMEIISKEIMEGMHSVCESLTAIVPSSTLPTLGQDI
jgi:hypothetical protein